MTGYPWETSMGPEGRPEIARDGSEVRLLVRTSDASVVHCTLPAGATSRATRNLGINEIWIIMAGQGELWHRKDDADQVTALGPGVCVTIPNGIAFQFRSLSNEPLAFVCMTMPPWPGPKANQPASLQKWEPGVMRTNGLSNDGPAATSP
jgi:mannose-6-phosphate isomerase-like protein (cupin superfamily)